MAQTLFDLLADPESAAFLPPFAKDLRKKPKNIDVLNAGIAGIGDLAYDVAGFPVDMSTALMRALGAQTGQTPFGSDWLKQKATNAGIRPPESADPTLRDVRLGAEMMAGGIDPFATAKGIGVVGSKVAKELEPTLINALDAYAQKAGLQPSILPQEAAKKVMPQTKIVDESGSPKLLYRGSRMEKGAPLDWNEARQSETGKGQDTGQWFSDNPSVGTSYAGSRRQQGYVAPAYLDMRNPLVVDAGGNTWGQIPREGLGELASRIPKETLTTDEIARIAKAQGYDGVEFRNIIDRGPEGAYVSDPSALERPSTVYVTFNPKAARSALSDKAIAGAARVPPRPKAPVQQAVQAPTIEAPVSPAGFYSAAEQAALNMTKTKGTGQSLLDELMKAPNVKKDELEYTGLIDAFADKKQATKQELIDYLQENRTNVGETRLMDLPEPKVQVTDAGSYYGSDIRTPDGESANDIFDLTYTLPNSEELVNYQAYRVGGGRGKPEFWQLYDNRGNMIDEYDSIEDATDYVQREVAFEMRSLPSNPEYSNYTLKGGENYREVLLTLPERPDGAQFGSSHWSEPNVFAHLRLNDRIDADGKKMTLIEEVQSDWHQQGRERGYIGNYKKEDVKPYTPEQAKAEFGLDNADLFWYFNVPDNTLQIPKSRFATQDEAINYVLTEKKVNATGVPDAPMKDTWYQTALRKAVKDAIDQGSDRVGILTGARQAERYDLSKQISEVHYSGSNFVAYDKNGRAVVERTGVTDNDLPDLIGKEAAKKLLEQPKQGTLRSLSGVDLQVGGEGMKTYYDEIYPKYLDKFAKKYGSSVKEGSINAKGEEWPFPISIESDGKKYWLAGRDPRTDTPNAILSNKFDDIADAYKQRDQMYSGFTEKVRYIEITPEMRKAFGGKDKGVPLFQMAPAIPAGAIGAGGLLDQFGQEQ